MIKKSCSEVISVTVAKEPHRNGWGLGVETGHVLEGSCQDGEERGRGEGALNPE